jgi:hypothetical protein
MKKGKRMIWWMYLIYKCEYGTFKPVEVTIRGGTE